MAISLGWAEGTVPPELLAGLNDDAAEAEVEVEDPAEGAPEADVPER